MWRIPCQLSDPIPEDPTTAVTASFSDASNTSWTFQDKLALFRSTVGDGARCQLDRVGRYQSKLSYWVCTHWPDSLSSQEGDETNFIVSKCVFQGSVDDYRDKLDLFEQRDGWIDIDVLQHEIAVGLSILPATTTFGDAKPMYWSASDEVGLFTMLLVRLLEDREMLQAMPDDDTMFRWV